MSWYVREWQEDPDKFAILVAADYEYLAVDEALELAQAIQAVAERRALVIHQGSDEWLLNYQADSPPDECEPEHLDPEEISLGFGGITYRCMHCEAEWFRPVRPGEPV